jgi:hypothetical protein
MIIGMKSFLLCHIENFSSSSRYKVGETYPDSPISYCSLTSNSPHPAYKMERQWPS